MEYYDKTVNFIAIIIEDLRKYATEKGARFSQRYFLHKVSKGFGRERSGALTKEMNQLNRIFFLRLSLLNT